VAASPDDLLERIATGTPIAVVLREIVGMVEHEHPGTMVSVLFVEGPQLRRIVAPSLPPGFNALIEGLRVGEGSGVCGTAVARRAPVVVHDVRVDPLVADFRELAAAVGIQAAWSAPVLLDDGEAVATLALYRRVPHTPPPEEFRSVAKATRLVRILVERERAARQHRDLDRQLRATLESISEALLVLDPNWHVTYLNTEAARLLQRDRSLLLGRNVWEAFPEAVGGPFQQQYERARRENTPVHFEEFFGPLEGWFEIHAYPSPEGLAIYFRNVTARREVNARMAEQAALLDIARDAILVRALDDKVLYWNKGAERVYGWSSAEALGKSTRDLMNADSKEFDAAKAELLKHGDWSGTLRQVNRRGERLTMECRWTLVRDERGAPLQILAINTDVTERRALEMQFLRTQRLESIGTLAGGIAHDLNNVLAPVLMSLEMLRELAGPRGTDLIDSLEGNVKRGADLIRQVLTFARGLDGKRESLDVAAVVRDVERFARDTFPRSITIEGPAEGRIAMVVGDSTQLHQVVMNLAVNARDAMPNGGKLRLDVAEQVVTERDAATAEVPPGAYVAVSVSDTGAGIPHEIQSAIFEPFYTTKDVGHGTGLGLSTVMSIVRSHGGTVHLVSEPGFGARFTCLLPSAAPALATRDGPSARPRSSSPVPATAGGLILVVDDERLIRVSAGHILERHGYRVQLAAHGGEAVEFVRSTHDTIAAMICDVAMPVMDGPATVAAVRQLLPNLPIIVASGYMGDDGAQKLIGTGVEHFISKPFTAERLLSTLRSVLVH
jgi:two-component system cell cycle sensor histidine kinase/response regulator CckA